MPRMRDNESMSQKEPNPNFTSRLLHMSSLLMVTKLFGMILLQIRATIQSLLTIISGGCGRSITFSTRSWGRQALVCDSKMLRRGVTCGILLNN
ncbi:hypothetical protein L208DRAFT_1478719 [Tricholoma matsutake]|nr:hypothetical protein L208DRAFT_1478719 [Tricholoma matsutake 945]